MAGGVTVTITGLRFRAGATVTIGGIAATSVVIVSSTSITCTAPAVAENIVDVVVTNANGESGTLVQGFTYIAGHIISLSINRGLTTGGTNLTINGTNFVAGSTVKFGGVAATAIIVDSRTIFVVTGAHAEGTVDVTITEPSTAVVTGKKLFTYSSSVFNSDIRRMPGISIQQTLNSGPNSARFAIDQKGVPPVGGEKVTFTDGTTLLFLGEVTNVRQNVEGSKDNWSWDITALDERFRFNRKRPFGTWDNVSISVVARELITQCAPEFNADFVQARLPRVSLVLNGDDDLNTVFTKLAGAMNEGHWYIDNRSVHLFQLATSLGTSESPVSALVLPSIGPMTAGVSTTSVLGYTNFVKGWYIFMSMNAYGVPPAGDPDAKVYDALSGTGVSAMAGRANASNVFLNYGQGGTPSLAVLPGQDTAHSRWIMLSRQAANRNLQGDISNGVYCTSVLFPRGWTGVDADGTPFADGVWPAAGPNAIYFASSDVWTALETASGPPSAPVQAYFESSLSQISNPVYLEKFLPSLSNIPLGAVVGGRNCTARKIFYVRYGDPDGTGVQGYNFINDNTTTGPVTLALDPVNQFQVPAHQNVNPPAGPVVQPSMSDSGIAVDPLAFAGKVAKSGYWAIKVTGVYRDNTESKGSLASGPIFLNGTNQALAKNLPIFPIINGVDCVFRRIYASVFRSVSDPTAAGVPDFDEGHTQPVAIVPNNTASEATFPFGGWTLGGDHQPEHLPPGELSLPGPDLEAVVQPEDIDANSTMLLLDPPITTESDTTQLRNRVYVKGKGSIMAEDALAGATLIKLADVSTFSPSGGTFIVGSRIIQYRGSDQTATPPQLLLTQGLAQPITQADWKFGGGTPILPIVIVNDLASQKYYGQLELDPNGQATDGVHEYTISDDGLTNIGQMYARGLAELKLFSRPVVSLSYATRDPLTKAGKVVHVDLDYPPIHGDFIIQEVTIDQIHDENDDLAPRYTVTADSAARFNMNDLLLKLSEATEDAAGGSSAGVVSTAVDTATDAATVLIASAANGSVQVFSFSLSDSDLIAIGTTPLTILGGQIGAVYFPLYWSYIMDKNASSWTNGGTTLQLQYTSGTDIIMGNLSLALNNAVAQTIVASNIASAFTLQSVSSGHTTVGDGLRIRTAAVLARGVGPPVSAATNIKIEIAYYVFSR